MNRESALVLNCTRVGIDDQHVRSEIEKLLDRPVNWQEVISSASQHGVVPFLHTIIADLNSHGVPNSVRETVRGLYLAQNVHSMRLDSELRKLLEVFRSIDLPVIVLKGPAIAEKVYTQRSLRTYSDIDLLINFDDFYRAKDVLESRGYSASPDIPPVLNRDTGLEWGFQKKVAKSRFLIELHWMMIDPCLEISIDKFESAVWQNAQLGNLVGAKTLLMKPEDLLIYTCLHLSVQHNFSNLVWFRDLFELTRRFSSLDWDYITSTAKELEICTQIYYSLYFCRELIGGYISNEVLNGLKKKNLTAMLFEMTFDPVQDVVAFKKAGAWLMMRDNRRQRSKAILKRIFPQTSELGPGGKTPSKRKRKCIWTYPILVLTRWFEIAAKFIVRTYRHIIVRSSASERSNS